MLVKRYKSIYRIPGKLIIAACSVLCTVSIFAGDVPEGVLNYFKLREFYLKWDMGVYDTRGYQRRMLNSYLIDLIGNEIQTDYDFFINPDILYGKGDFSSPFMLSRWLLIHGIPEGTNAGKNMPGFRELLRDMEVEKTLYSVSGKIKRFRIEETVRGRMVHLYLDRLKIKPLISN